MIAGVILFQLVTILMNQWKIPEFKEDLDLLNIVSILLLLIIPVGKMISDKRISAIDQNLDLASRFSLVQTSLIIRWATIEGPAFFSIVAFLLLQDGRQLVVFLVCLVAFILANPGMEKVSSYAKLSAEEKNRMM